MEKEIKNLNDKLDKKTFNANISSQLVFDNDFNEDSIFNNKFKEDTSNK